MTKNKVSILNLNEGPIKTKTIGKILVVTIDRPKANAIGEQKWVGQVEKELAR